MTEELQGYASQRILRISDNHHPSPKIETGLKILAPHLQEPIQIKLVRQLFAVPFWFIDGAPFFEILAPYLTEHAIEIAFGNCMENLNKSDQQRALVILAPYLSKDLLVDSFASFTQLAKPLVLAEALVSLGNELPIDEKRQIFEASLEIVSSQENEYGREQTIEGIAKLVRNDPKLAKDILQTTISMGITGRHIFTTMVNLLPNFAEGCENFDTVKVFSAGLESELLELKLLALSILAKCGEDHGISQDQTLHVAFDTIMQLKEGREIIEAFRLFGAYLHGQFLNVALKFLIAIDPSGSTYVDFLTDLSSVLHEAPNWFERIFAKLVDFSGHDYAMSLIALAPALGKHQVYLELAIEVARRLRFYELRYEILAHLAVQHADEIHKRNLLEELMEAIQRIEEEEHFKAEMFEKTAWAFGNYEDLSRKAFTCAQQITDSYYRGRALQCFAENPFVSLDAIIEIRKAFLFAILDNSDSYLEHILGLLSDEKSVQCMNLSSEILRRIIAHVIDICQEWTWL